MTKLKSASDWATERVKDDNPKLFELFIADIQKNAIEAALEIASKSAKTEMEQKAGKLCPDFYIDKQSITSLINHKDLKL